MTLNAIDVAREQLHAEKEEAKSKNNRRHEIFLALSEGLTLSAVQTLMPYLIPAMTAGSKAKAGGDEAATDKHRAEIVDCIDSLAQAMANLAASVALTVTGGDVGGALRVAGDITRRFINCTPNVLLKGAHDKGDLSIALPVKPDGTIDTDASMDVSAELERIRKAAN